MGGIDGTIRERQARALGNIRARLGEVADDYIIIARFRYECGKTTKWAYSDDVWAAGAVQKVADYLRGLE